MDLLIPIVIGGIAGTIAGGLCEKRKSRGSKYKETRRETYNSPRTSSRTYRTLEQPYDYDTMYPENSALTYETYRESHRSRDTTSLGDFPFPATFGPSVHEYPVPMHPYFSMHCSNCHREHIASQPCINTMPTNCHFGSQPPRWKWCNRCEKGYDSNNILNSARKCKIHGCTSPTDHKRFRSNSTSGPDYCAMHMGMIAHYMSEKRNEPNQSSNRGLITEGPATRRYLLTDGYGTY